MSRTITDALQKVFLKLGGNVQDIQDNKTVTDYVDDLGEVLESLAELPGVTSSDNGKILKVVDGKWNKADASGGGIEFFDVNYTKATYGEDVHGSIDKTFYELVAAFKANKIIRLKIGDTPQYISDVTFSNISMIPVSTSNDLIAFVGRGFGISSDNEYSITINIEEYNGVIDKIETIY